MTLFFLFLALCSAGQQLPYLNGKTPIAPDSVANLYFNNQDLGAAIYNGRVFYGYLPSMKGHPYYPGQEWVKGSVLYDGNWYPDIALKYDINLDEVIVLHPNGMPVRLLSERVQQFYFDGLIFVRLNAGKANGLKNGFYQKLAEGNVTVFASRQKKIEENIVDLTIERTFVSLNYFYVLKDGTYHPVYKQKSLMGLLRDSRQGIVAHLKQQKLKYKTDKEKTIIQMAEFYNQSHK